MSRAQFWISLTVIVGFLLLTLMLVFLRSGLVDIPNWIKDSLILIVGAWVAKFGSVIDFALHRTGVKTGEGGPPIDPNTG